MYSTAVDIERVLAQWATPGLAKALFHPLDDFHRKRPLEDIKDVFQSLRNAVTFEGKLYGVPVPSSGDLLWCSKVLWKEAGVSFENLPRTVEEMKDNEAVAKR